MKKPYFHELPQEKVDDLLSSGTTVGFILDNFLQPDWCGYHQALIWKLGCWSLTDVKPGGLRTKICKEFCSGCDDFIDSDKQV